MKKRYLINTITTAVIFVTFLVILSTVFGQTLGRESGDLFDQHTKFIDYMRLNFWASGDFFPQWMMNYGLGQSFTTLFYYGLYNPFLLIMYVLPRLNPMYIFEIIYLIILIINTVAMTKLLDLNGIKGNLNSFIAILSSFSGYYIYMMGTHPMFVYYLPIFVVSLIALHYMAKANHKGLYSLCVGLIFFTNFTFAPMISVMQFMYYTSLLAEENRLKVKNYIPFFASYIIGVGIGMLMLIPQALQVVSATTRTASIKTTIQLFTSYDLIIDVLASDPWVSGTFIFTLTGLLGTIIFLRNKRNNIMIGTMLLILLLVPLNIAFNLFQYTNVKIYVWYMPILWMYFGLVVQKVNKKQLLILMSVSLYLLILGEPLFQRLIPALISIIILAISYYAVTTKNKYTSYLVVVIISFVGASFYSQRVDNEVIEDYFVSANVKQDFNYTNGRYLATDINNIYGIDKFYPNIYTSLENGYYIQATRDEYKSAKSGNIRTTKTFTFNNPYYINFFGINSELFTSNPIVYGVLDSDTINISEYQNLDNTQTMEAVSQYLFTNDSNNDSYESNFNYETIIDDPSEFTLIDGTRFTYEIPEQYQNGILTISAEAELPEDKSVQSLLIANNQENYVRYADYYGLNENGTPTFIFDTTTTSEINLVVDNFIGGDVTYRNLKVVYQPYSDFIENKLEPIVPTNFEVDLNDSFSFDLSMSEDGYLSTTIPFDSGFTITVDGEQVETEIVNNVYLGTKLTSGEHSVVISYQMPGFRLGLILTCISLCGAIIFILLDIRNHKLNK